MNNEVKRYICYVTSLSMRLLYLKTKVGCIKMMD